MVLTLEGPCIIFAIYIQSNEIHNVVALIKFLLVLRCQLIHNFSWYLSTNKNLISATMLCISLNCTYIIKMVINKIRCMWTGFIWLRMGSSDGNIVMNLWVAWKRFLSLPKWLLDSHDTHFCTAPVTLYVPKLYHISCSALYIYRISTLYIEAVFPKLNCSWKPFLLKTYRQNHKGQGK